MGWLNPDALYLALSVCSSGFWWSFVDLPWFALVKVDLALTQDVLAVASTWFKLKPGTLYPGAMGIHILQVGDFSEFLWI